MVWYSSYFLIVVYIKSIKINYKFFPLIQIISLKTFSKLDKIEKIPSIELLTIALRQSVYIRIQNVGLEMVQQWRGQIN